MLNRFSRTELLVGNEAMEKLKNSRVAVFGIGGVGGYTVEALVRRASALLILLMTIRFAQPILTGRLLPQQTR